MTDTRRFPEERQRRFNRAEEIFELTCRCGAAVEIPVRSVIDGRGECPACGAALDIRWRPEAA